MLFSRHPARHPAFNLKATAVCGCTCSRPPVICLLMSQPPTSPTCSPLCRLPCFAQPAGERTPGGAAPAGQPLHPLARLPAVRGWHAAAPAPPGRRAGGCWPALDACCVPRAAHCASLCSLNCLASAATLPAPAPSCCSPARCCRRSASQRRSSSRRSRRGCERSCWLKALIQMQRPRWVLAYEAGVRGSHL